MWSGKLPGRYACVDYTMLNDCKSHVKTETGTGKVE